MDLGLDHKVVIITGGSRGIGLACATVFFAEGARVILVARDQDALGAAARQLKAAHPQRAADVRCVAADLLGPGAAERVIDDAATAFGRIDVLVNSAGSARAGAFLSLSDEDFEAAWRLKFLGYVRMIRAVAPTMIRQRAGSIINIVGGAARTPRSTFLPGSTTNAAVLNLTRGLVRELAPNGVRINAVSPGNTATERQEMLILQEAEARGLDPVAVRAERVAGIPSGRLVEPEEVAWTVVALASERAAATTGTEVVVDGGQMPGV